MRVDEECTHHLMHLIDIEYGMIVLATEIHLFALAIEESSPGSSEGNDSHQAYIPASRQEYERYHPIILE